MWNRLGVHTYKITTLSISLGPFMETSHAPQKPIQSQSWKNATVAEKSSSAHPVSNFYSDWLEEKERVRFHAPKNGFPQRKHSNIFLGKQIWRSWRTKFPPNIYPDRPPCYCKRLLSQQRGSVGARSAKSQLIPIANPHTCSYQSAPRALFIEGARVSALVSQRACGEQ